VQNQIDHEQSNITSIIFTWGRLYERRLRGCLCKNHPLNFNAKLDFSYKLSLFLL
jgi:hypothetical protein